MIWLLLATALAQDPDPDPAEEIVVWGELAVLQARDRIVAEMEELGWRPRRRDGRTVFKGPRGWMGAMILDDEGTIDFRTPALGFAPRPPQDYTFDPRYEQVDPNDLDLEVGAGPTFWVGVSQRKLAPVRAEVVRAIEDDVESYREILQRTAFEEQLTALPEQLDRLWQEGVPLQPGPPLEAKEDRRRAVLEHWATRADTPEGRRVMEAMEAWLEGVVQESEHPITPEERLLYEARQQGDRSLPQ